MSVSLSVSKDLSLEEAYLFEKKEAEGKEKKEQEISPKYPLSSKVTKLISTFEIKQSWLYNEWAQECQFSKYIRPSFPNREDLHPTNKNPNIRLITSVFDSVRGQFALWQAPREEARWKKIEVVNLQLDWVLKNVDVLYPSTERFPVLELNGIVLWDDKSNSSKRYKLYEGNHRISAWLASKSPLSLPAIIFIGKPKRVSKDN